MSNSGTRAAIQLRQRTAANAVSSGLSGCLVAIRAVWSFLPSVGLPYAFLALAFWAADGSWDFEGDNNNFRYWLFVSGKQVEEARIGGADRESGQYSVSGSDGNFPGRTIVQYESKAAPAEVIDAYTKRCESLKAKWCPNARYPSRRRARSPRVSNANSPVLLPHGGIFRRTDIVVVPDGGRPAGFGAWNSAAGRGAGAPRPMYRALAVSISIASGFSQNFSL